MQIMGKTGNLQLFIVFAVVFGLFGYESFGQKKQGNGERLIDNGVTYEMPKVYELMHIAIALTDTTIVSNGYNVYKGVVNTSTPYYREVMEHFGKYRDHKLIRALNESIKKNPSNYLSNLQMAYNAVLKYEKVAKLKKMPWARRVAYSINSVKREYLDDFSRISKFDSFYKNHSAYYKKVLERTKELADVNSQQVWLEQNFETKYDRYNIVLSPLMYGTHFTQRFSFKQEKKCIMWVAIPDEGEFINDPDYPGRYIGVVMTEIDHNYVNPASDKYGKRLKGLMGGENRSKWVKPNYSSNAYKTGYKVFNEYMTHAVYLIYTSDRFQPDEQHQLEISKINSMEEIRGFVNFGNFYRELKRVHLLKKTNGTIESIYPDMLEWCKQQNGQ